LQNSKADKWNDDQQKASRLAQYGALASILLWAAGIYYENPLILISPVSIALYAYRHDAQIQMTINES